MFAGTGSEASVLLRLCRSSPAASRSGIDVLHEVGRPGESGACIIAGYWLDEGVDFLELRSTLFGFRILNFFEDLVSKGINFGRIAPHCSFPYRGCVEVAVFGVYLGVVDEYKFPEDEVEV